MLARVGIKVKVKQVEVSVLIELDPQGRVPGLDPVGADPGPTRSVR